MGELPVDVVLCVDADVEVGMPVRVVEGDRVEEEEEVDVKEFDEGWRRRGRCGVTC